MNFLLIDAICDLQLGFTKKQELSFFAVTPFSHAKPLGNHDNWQEFTKLATEKFVGKNANPIVVTFSAPKTSASGYDFSKREVAIRGDLLLQLHRLFHADDINKKLNIEFKAVLVREARTPGFPHKCRGDKCTQKVGVLGKIIATGFSPTKTPGGSTNHGEYSLQKAIPVPKKTLRIACSRDKWMVKLKVSTNGVFDFDRISGPCETGNGKFLRDKRFSDFTIISSDGTLIPCHKIFLAKSPVLLAMLEGNYQEAKENKMTSDMTTQGVQALLEYLYCEDVQKAETCGEIALELLVAADKYDLPGLWTTVKEIVSAKDHSWFEVDVALKMFDLMNKTRRGENRVLLHKMLRVLAENPKQLSKSTLLPEMFIGSAREMFAMALAASIV